MKIGIFANHNKPQAKETANVVAKLITKYGGEGLIFPDSAKGAELSGPIARDIIENSDMIIVLGGDGTIIRLAKIASLFNLPILGVNLGRLGFLSEVEKDGDLERAVEKIIKGDYTVEERSMLSIKCGSIEYVSLNEVMLGRYSQKIISADLFIDDKFFYNYYADGLLVSTSTGSTAYSLSAGGPILCPGVKAMVVTAVCPHSLYNRSIVVGENQKIDLKVSKKSPSAILMVDGEYKCELCEKDVVTVSSSSKKARFVRIDEYNFFTRLTSKLNTWSISSEDKND